MVPIFGPLCASAKVVDFSASSTATGVSSHQNEVPLKRKAQWNRISSFVLVGLRSIVLKSDRHIR